MNRTVFFLVVVLLLASAIPALATEEGEGGHHEPPPWLVIFFVVLLLLIAVLPLTPLHEWWENNRNRLLVSLAMAAYPAWYYIQHDPHSLAHTMMHEYVPFIVLLGALFVIAGGIRLTGDIAATPSTNTAFIAVGTLLASFIGTTGASMLLIRPLLVTNQERIYRTHTVIFFIFLVSNIGGSLLPIGDPPLFLGYLAGVPFFWTLQLWPVWLPTSAFLLVVYYLFDRRMYARESPMTRELDRRMAGKLRVQGSRNFVWLLGVVAAVVVMHEESPVPLFRFLYCRELAMVLMVVCALIFSPRRYWTENRFTMHPIGEVAALFLGIFVTMTPALVLLRVHGGELPLDNPLKYFWGTGVLSAFLDNAPTYLVFFKTAAGAAAAGTLNGGELIGMKADQVPHTILMGISLGAVFMGALTYIGNGPNFMVRAIAHEAGVKMPTFFGYMKWSALILIPTFVLISLVFFR